MTKRAKLWQAYEDARSHSSVANRDLDEARTALLDHLKTNQRTVVSPGVCIYKRLQHVSTFITEAYDFFKIVVLRDT